MTRSNGQKSVIKRVFTVIGTVLTAIIILLAIAIFVNMIICRAKNKPVSFFGSSFAIVQTESMEPYIMTGDLILFKSVDYDDVKVGDYVVFVAGEGFGQMKGQSIVHEAIQITPDGIVTKGKNQKTNPIADSDYLTEDNLLGVCTFNSAGWGKLFSFIGKYGILIIIAIIAVPFIVRQAIKIVKLSKQKETDTANAGDDARTDGADIPQFAEKSEDGESPQRDNENTADGTDGGNGET